MLAAGCVWPVRVWCDDVKGMKQYRATHAWRCIAQQQLQREVQTLTSGSSPWGWVPRCQTQPPNKSRFATFVIFFFRTIGGLYWVRSFSFSGPVIPGLPPRCVRIAFDVIPGAHPGQCPACGVGHLGAGPRLAFSQGARDTTHKKRLSPRAAKRLLPTHFGALCFSLHWPTVLVGENVMHNALAWWFAGQLEVTIRYIFSHQNRRQM